MSQPATWTIIHRSKSLSSKAKILCEHSQILLIMTRRLQRISWQYVELISMVDRLRKPRRR